MAAIPRLLLRAISYQSEDGSSSVPRYGGDYWEINGYGDCFLWDTMRIATHSRPGLALRRRLAPFAHRVINTLPPRVRVTVEYMLVHHRWPNLFPPQTFNEKITWRKLYDHDPRMPDLVDKVKAKEIVARQVGVEVTIPTLRVYDSVEELDFSVPPLSQPPYVLKT